MKIPPSYFAYFALALFFGVILAFGVASMLHQPLPLQVPLTTQTLPNGDKTTTDVYAPAPVQVIVTTAPLPTITMNPTTASPVGMNPCAVSGSWNSTSACLAQETSLGAYAGIIQLTSLLITALLISFVLSYLIRL